MGKSVRRGEEKREEWDGEDGRNEGRERKKQRGGVGRGGGAAEERYPLGSLTLC